METDQPQRRICPHDLLNCRGQQIVQEHANGKNIREISFDLGLSHKTIESHERAIGNIGTLGRAASELKSRGPDQARSAIIALINDGIMYGYIDHELPEEGLKPLTRAQMSVANSLRQGLRDGEIARKSWNAVKTIEAHKKAIRQRLKANTDYHIVARLAAMERDKLRLDSLENEEQVT